MVYPHRMKLALLWPLITFLLAGCPAQRTRQPLETRQEAMRLAQANPILEDDLPLESLAEGLRKQVKRMREYHPYPYPMTFGNRQLSVENYILGLEHLAKLIETHTDRSALWESIPKYFDFYEVYGQKNWGEAFITSYFEPVIAGSRRKTKEHSSPLYKKPKDLIEVAVEQFDDRFKDIRRMRGRILKEKSKAGNPQLGPYFSREEIESQNSLGRRRLELAWVDPIDNFFLQVQGSGTVRFKNGKELRVGYAEQNGHVYQAIGKFVADAIPLEQLTLLSLESYLRSLTPEDRDNILFQNPSYVFFRKLDGQPLTSLGTEVVAGRTIATDGRFFPKGTVGFLKFKKPKFIGPILSAPADWVPTTRFVLDQDTGGAIRGGGRLDLFWGRGPEAKRHAAVMKQKGTLFYIAPKESLLAEIESLKEQDPKVDDKP